VSLLCREANANVISTTEFSAYPNPTTGKLTLSFDSETKSKYLVEVENIIGVKMLVEVVNLQEGNNLHELDLSTYAKGMYFLSLKAEGSETKTIRIVVE
jgi:hypothetical protein